MKSDSRFPTCSKCQFPIPATSFNLSEFAPCVRCNASLQVEIFNALFRPVKSGGQGEAALVDGESVCFYHEKNKAVVVCDACGRFLCGVCDCELAGQHLCPPCLETGNKKGSLEQLETVRVLHGRQAFVMALLPLFITGIAAIFIAIRYWKTPGSLVAPKRWQMPVALALGLLQTLIFSSWIIYAVMN